MDGKPSGFEDSSIQAADKLLESVNGGGLAASPV
jgi:hypothetical protein